MMSIKISLIAAWAICITSFLSKGQDLPPATSLVYPGTEGKLVYVADSLGNTIPDFSNAGYKGGGVSIPHVVVKETVWPVLGDNADLIQSAIDRVSALPPDASGFRGAVLLKMGMYTLEKPIYIKASGVVLRGEGITDAGTILFGKIPKADNQTAVQKTSACQYRSRIGCKTPGRNEANDHRQLCACGCIAF